MYLYTINIVTNHVPIVTNHEYDKIQFKNNTYAFIKAHIARNYLNLFYFFTKSHKLNVLLCFQMTNAT